MSAALPHSRTEPSEMAAAKAPESPECAQPELETLPTDSLAEQSRKADLWFSRQALD